MKIVRHDESRLKLKAAQRERLLKLSKDRKASRKDREWAKRHLAENDVLANPNTETRPKKKEKRPWSGLEDWLAGEGKRPDRNLAAFISESREPSCGATHAGKAQAVDHAVFVRIRALRKRLSLGKGESAKDLVNEGRRV